MNRRISKLANYTGTVFTTNISFFYACLLKKFLLLYVSISYDKNKQHNYYVICINFLQIKVIPNSFFGFSLLFCPLKCQHAFTNFRNLLRRLANLDRSRPSVHNSVASGVKTILELFVIKIIAAGGKMS